jgi:hypothetical protein
MASEPTFIEVSSMPELDRLVEEVGRTRRPRLLARNGKPIAMLVPAGSDNQRRKPTRLVDTSGLPPVPHRTVAELAGIAGSLPKPLTWDEIKDIVDEERAEAWRAKHG